MARVQKDAVFQSDIRGKDRDPNYLVAVHWLKNTITGWLKHICSFPRAQL